MVPHTIKRRSQAHHSRRRRVRYMATAPRLGPLRRYSRGEEAERRYREITRSSDHKSSDKGHCTEASPQRVKLDLKSFIRSRNAVLCPGGIRLTARTGLNELEGAPPSSNILVIRWLERKRRTCMRGPMFEERRQASVVTLA